MRVTSRGAVQTYSGFVGGVNYADSPYRLGDKEARDLLNVVATGRGGVRKRDGALVLAPTAGGLHSLGVVTLPGGASTLVGAGGTSLYAISTTGAATSLGVTLTANRPMEFMQGPRNTAQGPLYASNGVDNPIYWTGTGSAATWTGTAIPKALFLRYKGTRAWAANMPGGYTPSGGSALDDPGSAVVFSDLGNPRSFPAANVVLFDPNDGEQITGLGSVGPYLLVFKPSKTWVIYDLDTGANRQVGQGIGCVAHRSISESDEGTYFLANNQAVMLTNGSTFKRVSDRVRPLLEQITPAGRALATGQAFNSRYYLAFETASGRRTLDYDVRLDAWFVHNYAPQDWQVWAPAGVPHLYAARPLGLEQAFVPGRLTDGDAVFSAYWRGPFLTFGAPYLNKRVRRLHFDGKGQIRVLLAKDFRLGMVDHGFFDFTEDQGIWGDPTGSWGGTNGGTWGGAAEVGEAEVLTPGVARAWSVQFGNDIAQGFEVDSFSVAYQMRRD